MEITKRDDITYVLTSGGVSITAKNTGRGWACIGDTPPALMGKFTTIDAVKIAFQRHLGLELDKEAIATNPLIDSDVPIAGTVLDPTPPLPRRPVAEVLARDITIMLPLPKRAT